MSLLRIVMHDEEGRHCYYGSFLRCSVLSDCLGKQHPTSFSMPRFLTGQLPMGRIFGAEFPLPPFPLYTIASVELAMMVEDD